MLESIFLMEFNFKELEETLKEMEDPLEMPEIPGSHGNITYFYPEISVSINNSGAIGRILLKHINAIRMYTNGNRALQGKKKKITTPVDKTRQNNQENNNTE